MQPAAAHTEREWILIGMAESCAAKGFQHTTAEDVCEAAGVSPAAFEREFADLGECLGAAMELVVEEGWRALAEVGAADKPWGVEVRDGVASLLGLLAERPAFAHLALIAAPGAGVRGGSLYFSAKAALAAAVERGREEAREEVPASAARGALAGAETLVCGRILAGRTKELARLEPEIVYLLTVPYLGQEAAGRLAEAPVKRPALRAVA